MFTRSAAYFLVASIGYAIVSFVPLEAQAQNQVIDGNHPSIALENAIDYRVTRALDENCIIHIAIHSLSNSFVSDFAIQPAEFAEIIRWSSILELPVQSAPAWEWLGEGAPALRAAGEAWLVTRILKHFLASEVPQLAYRRVLLGIVLVNGTWAIVVRNWDQVSVQQERAQREHFIQLLRPLATSVPAFIQELARALPQEGRTCEARRWPELFVDRSFANGLALEIHTGLQAYARQTSRQ